MKLVKRDTVMCYNFGVITLKNIIQNTLDMERVKLSLKYGCVTAGMQFLTKLKKTWKNITKSQKLLITFTLWRKIKKPWDIHP